MKEVEEADKNILKEKLDYIQKMAKAWGGEKGEAIAGDAIAKGTELAKSAADVASKKANDLKDAATNKFLDLEKGALDTISK